MRRPFRLGSPEGMRADSPSRRTLRAGSLGALVLLATCFAIAIGDSTARLTITNLTPHDVKVVVADRTFPRVAPGAEATYQSGGPATVGVSVSYLPGQGVEGSAQRSFTLSPYQPASYGTTVYFACTTNTGIVSPGHGGPIMWKVTADTLASR